MKKKYNKVLVTGGAGFIGSNLCEELSKNNTLEIFSLDNYSTGKIENHVSGITYIKGDTKDILTIVDFVPDVVFHLGEYSRVEQSFFDINKVWESNIIGTQKVLEFCRKHSCKLIYAGSSTKFGDNGLGKKQSPYGWTKATNTELIVNYSSWFGLDFAITYFYNAYGKREIEDGAYATLIAIFAKKMRNNEPLTVVKPGTQIRNFTDVRDIVSGLILVSERGQGDEYGIGSRESYSVIEIAKMFDLEIDMIPERQGNRMTADVVVEKTESLGWKAKYSIKDYIRELKNIN